MKIGGTDADIEWKGFGPSADSADSLDDTEIEGTAEQLTKDSWWAPDDGYLDATFQAEVVANVTSLSLWIEITDETDPGYLWPRIWENSEGTPGDVLWTGSKIDGPLSPGWVDCDVDFDVSGTIWIGCTLADVFESQSEARAGYRSSGGEGAWIDERLGAGWVWQPDAELAYKLVTPYRVELVGSAGSYEETGTFTSGVIDLGVGIKLASVAWSSIEPSPTSIDTTPPAPKTLSIRASDTAPTIAKGGGIWVDKDVPDVTDPEWGTLAYSEYESEGTASVAHRKRYAQFRATLWRDIS